MGNVEIKRRMWRRKPRMSVRGDGGNGNKREERKRSEEIAENEEVERV